MLCYIMLYISTDFFFIMEYRLLLPTVFLCNKRKMSDNGDALKRLPMLLEPQSAADVTRARTIVCPMIYLQAATALAIRASRAGRDVGAAANDAAGRRHLGGRHPCAARASRRTRTPRDANRERQAIRL